MKIAHFCTFRTGKVSGMTNSVKEICEAEIELGVDAGICDPLKREGEGEVQLRRRKVDIKPWSWALDKECVTFISSSPSDVFYELPHRVYILHGMPQFAFIKQLLTGESSMDTSIAMIRECDASICWSNFEGEYWRAMYPEESIHVVNHGVDLEYWCPDEPEKPFRWHPTVVHADVTRIVKLPFTLLFATKLAQRRIPLLKLNLLSIDPKQQTMWMMMIAKLDLELIVENMLLGLLVDPREIFRAADIFVSSCQHGLMSRVSIEALACGTPVIVFEGLKDSYATMKCKDSPSSISRAMVKLWSKMKSDPERIREQARQTAEKHYDVQETAQEFIRIAEGLL